MIPLFDLHCDTFLELYKNKYKFDDAPLHISLNKIKCFSPYIQICAIWSEKHLSNNDAFINYKNTLSYIKAQNLPLCKSACNFSSISFILAVEDARILDNKINRLDELLNDNVRILTLNWKGVSCVGGGWDTNVGLTPFGLNVVKNCFKKGIVVDLSHSSENVQNEVISLAQSFNVSPIFSHSNSFSICNHKRNITDVTFKKIAKLNGLVGISLFPEHLSINGNANTSVILNHIEHFLNLGGEKSICLGCDFDGISSLPIGFKSISDLPMLYALIEKYFSKEVANRIFFLNAYNFFIKNFK